MQMLMQQWLAMRPRDVEAYFPTEEASSMELSGTVFLEVNQSEGCRMQGSGNLSTEVLSSHYNNPQYYFFLN